MITVIYSTVQYSTDFRFYEIFDSCKVGIVMEGNIKSIEQREDQVSKAEVAQSHIEFMS